MSSETKRPATFREIRDVCRMATAEFVVEQQERGATLEEAQTAYVDHLNERLEAMRTAARGSAAMETKPISLGPIDPRSRYRRRW